jgi:hypothetical protein
MKIHVLSSLLNRGSGLDRVHVKNLPDPTDGVIILEGVPYIIVGVIFDYAEEAVDGAKLRSLAELECEVYA